MTIHFPVSWTVLLDVIHHSLPVMALYSYQNTHITLSFGGMFDSSVLPVLVLYISRGVSDPQT